MRVLLLDTNTLNYILKERQPAVDRLQKAREKGPDSSWPRSHTMS